MQTTNELRDFHTFLSEKLNLAQTMNPYRVVVHGTKDRDSEQTGLARPSFVGCLYTLNRKAIT